MNNEQLKKHGLEFLNYLNGYHIRLKEIHWNTTCKAEHLLTDDIDGGVLEYEDKLAENLMGCGDFRFEIDELKTMLPSARTLSEILKEMQSDVNGFQDKLDDKEHAGIINILEDFTEDINKWKYLATFK